MTLQLERPAPPAAAPARSAPASRHAYRAGFLVALVSVLASVVLLPFAIVSLAGALRHPTNRAFDLGSTARLHGEWTKLNVAAVAIDESNGLLTLRVTGFHDCPSRCPTDEIVKLYSVHADPSGALGSPPSTSIRLPADSSEVDQEVTLPVTGELVDYPFDHYQLLLGVSLTRVARHGSTALTPSTARSALAFGVDDAIPRLSLATPHRLSPARYDAPGATYDSVTTLNFYRPAYLRILTVLLTLLIVLAAAYGVLFRPFTQIIPTVGGLVLGVWGVRSLLVGSYPPDSTGVDLVLEAAILLLLVAVAVRAAIFAWPRTLLGRAAPSAEEGEDPSDPTMTEEWSPAGDPGG